MKQVLTGAVLLVLVAIVAPPAEAAECSRVRAPGLEEALTAPETPDQSSAAPALQEQNHSAVPQVRDGDPAIKPATATFDHCPNWACWQDPWGCTCEGFWCGPIFICGIPCRETGC